jgi:transposase
VYLSDFDLQQLDEAKVSQWTPLQKEALLWKVLADLKEARERLKANSQTSSRPPSSEPLWLGKEKKAEGESEAGVEVTAGGRAEGNRGAPGEAPEMEASPGSRGGTDRACVTPAKRAGRPRGAPGHSRVVSLAVSSTVIHRPEHCALCGQALAEQAFIAGGGLYVLDIERESGEGLGGLRLRHDKHLYGEVRCGCGHVNRSEPGRCANEPEWTVALSEWQLVGPMLATLIVCLALRLHLSRRRIPEFLRDWLGVELSTSTITHCIHESGRAVEPIEEQLVEELQQACLAHADETPWKEWGQLLWLWVITTPTLCLYWIGSRSKALLSQILGEEFLGWLMSDGYHVYRQFKHRLRCWAHLLRKARGLKECLSAEARAFGEITHDLLSTLMRAIYQARAGPPVKLQDPFAERLAAFRAVCEQHRDSAHEKTRALAREFLNDWEAIWIVLEHPYLPLTNNEAERALRHWVIARRISQGTRTAQGSRALALLASVIETCRKRNILPWPYLAHVLAERRKGHPAPPLPTAAVP